MVGSRLLGCFSAVSVVSEIGEWRMRALVGGVFLPDPGTRVGITADPTRTFIFPAS